MKPAPHIAAEAAPLTADEAAQLLATLEAATARLRVALRCNAEAEADEWLSTREAVALANLGSQQVARDWARRYKLGRRRPDGRWEISKTLLLAVVADRRARSK